MGRLNSVQSLLEAMDGTAYLTDPTGVILAIGSAHWTEFARAANADLPPSSIIGQNLFDFITPGPVRSVYAELHDAVVTHGEGRVTLAVRCDAPDVERRLKLSISAVRDEAGLAAVLYQAQTLSETVRPPFRHLAMQEAMAQLKGFAGKPILRICSFCGDVARPGPESAWMSPTHYYRDGGAAEVQLSHGICPGCAERLPVSVSPERVE